MTLAAKALVVAALALMAVPANADGTVFYSKKPWTVIRFERDGEVTCVARSLKSGRFMELIPIRNGAALNVEGEGLSFQKHQGTLWAVGKSVSMELLNANYDKNFAMVPLDTETLDLVFSTFEMLREPRIGFRSDSDKTLGSFEYKGWKTVLSKLQECRN